MKKLKVIIIPIIVTVIFITAFNLILNNLVLDKEIEQLSVDRDLSGIGHAYGGSIKKSGTQFRDIALENDDLMLLGSSELSSKVPQNPINIFPFNGANYDVSTFGVAHVQDLQHATMLGGSNKCNENSKVALVVSLQWFCDKDGIKTDNFISGFSEQQFYQFLNNPKISQKNKMYLAKRVSGLLKSADTFQEEKCYADGFIGETFSQKAKHSLTLPYFKVKGQLTEIKDKLATIKELKKLPVKSNVDKVKEIDFEKEYITAEEQGLAAVTNNRFNVDDSYYDKYLRDRDAKLENTCKDVDVTDSVEFDDFKFFLSVCEDLKIKPYIILMNVNGWYYDYTGISENERTEFYNKLENITRDEKFDVLNLQKHEYEKYYLKDVMHLGWKGWLNVSEEMSKYFKDK